MGNSYVINFIPHRCLLLNLLDIYIVLRYNISIEVRYIAVKYIKER